MNFEKKHVIILLVAVIVFSVIIVCYKCFVYPVSENFISEINVDDNGDDSNFGSINGIDNCRSNYFELGNGSNSSCAAPLQRTNINRKLLVKNDEDYFENAEPLKIKSIVDVGDECNKCEISREVFRKLNNKGYLININPAWDELYGDNCGKY